MRTKVTLPIAILLRAAFALPYYGSAQSNLIQINGRGIFCC